MKHYSDRMLRPMDCILLGHIREGNRLVPVEYRRPSRNLLGSNYTRTSAPSEDEERK